MSLKSFIVVAAALVVLAAGSGPQLISRAQAAGCEAGDKIDSSSAESAGAKIEKAGYQHVHDLKKSCDNFWHGKAVKDGVAVNVALSPKGDVMLEGD